MLKKVGELKLDTKSVISFIDEIYSSYLLNHDKKRFCSDLSSALNKLASNSNGKSRLFEVYIVDSKLARREPFFGMRVFPDAEELEPTIKAIQDGCNSWLDGWRHISSWIIEIDSRVFDRMAINFNPKELTAMTLHEIGHTIYSDTKIERFYRAYQECKLHMSSSDKASAKTLYFLYQIPLLLVCGMRDWRLSRNDLREELFADTTVEKLGYGTFLVSAYQKIIKIYGNSGYTSDAKADAKVEHSIKWCNLNAHDLVHRKNKLKDELYQTGLTSNSSYIRKVISNIMKRFGIQAKDKYTGNIVIESALDIPYTEDFVLNNDLQFNLKTIGTLENYINSLQASVENQIAIEAKLFRKSKNGAEIPSQLDVDTIFVEVDRIENHADRRYVLDLIYHQEEKIEKFKELFPYNPELKSKYSGKMESMLKELESMRQAVLNKRNFNKDYKVFVKYPAGYEG